MSTTIDQKVVEMRFDNKQFENNVQTSMSSIDKLKQSLNFTGASKSLENVNSAVKNVNMSGLSSAIETVQVKFSALEVMAVTALANITNSAINTGKRMISALTIDPVKTGFSEYETQINAVQTILANTSSKGTTLDQVNAALDTLNTYADKTIYNFTEMTRNIGTFTAAGIDLDTSVTAIQGIANLAAVSGSNAQQASTAMYQLSQALASGTVKLMDWNSVVNAGMGGQVFQDALKETARVHGIAIDQMITSEGSFRETLKDGWLTSEILTETLSKFTMATEGLTEAEIEKNREMLRGQGYTEKQIEEIFKLGNTATNAATKVKTFTQLWDTLKEAAQSGWTQSWEIIVGDFEEAKMLFTDVSNVIGEMIGSSANARNEVLQGWKDLGGRTAILDAIRNAFEGIMGIIKPIKEAFREVFPPITAKQLTAFSEGLRDLTAKLKLSDSQSKQLKTTFKGLFAAIDIAVEIIKAIVNGIRDLATHFTGLNDGVLGVTSSFGDWIINTRNAVKETDIFGKSIDSITGFLGTAIDKMKDFSKFIQEKFVAPGFEGFLKLMRSIWEIISKIGSKISEIGSRIGNALSNVLSFENISSGLSILNGGLFAGILIGIKKFVNDLADTFDGVNGILENVTGILDSVRGCFEAYQQNLKAKTLLAIAGAIAILAGAILVIAMIDPKKLSESLGAITILFGELMASLFIFSKISGNIKGVTKSCAAMISMSISIAILAIALKTISTIDFKGLAKGLVAVGALMAELSIFLNTAKFGGKVTSTATGIVILSLAMLILAKAVENFGGMSWETIGKGLSAIGALLLEISVFTNLTGNAKHVVSTGIAITLLGAAMKIFASAISDFGQMDLNTIGKGLLGMAGALFAVTIALNLMPKNMIGIGAGLLAVSVAVKVLSGALGSIGNMSWEGIAKGLAALGGSIAILAIGLNTMNGTLAGSAAMVVAVAALALLTPILAVLSAMSWEGIAKGLTTIAGAFTIIGIAGAVLTPLVPTILALGGAFALIGVGVLGIGAGLMAAGVGLSALAAGFTALATAGAAGATAIVASLTIIITGVAGLIPAIVAKLGEGIVVFCEALIAGAPAICKAFVTIVTSVVAALVASIPLLVDGIFQLLTSILTTLAKYTPAIVQAAFDVLIACLKGIADNIGMVVQTAIDIVIGFIDGISQKIPDVIQAGFDLLLSFINGITEAINTNTPLLVKAMKDLFWALVNAAILVLTGGIVSFKDVGNRIMNSGLIQGIKDKISNLKQTMTSLINAAKQCIISKFKEWRDAGRDILQNVIDGISSMVWSIKRAVTNIINDAKRAITDKIDDFFDIGANIIEGLIDGVKSAAKKLVRAVKNVLSDALDSAKDFLGINSPSKEFAKIGRYSDEGLVVGLKSYSGKVADAAAGVGKTALNSMKNTIAGIANAVNSDIDSQPTIRPVLDLSNVETGTRRLSSMFSRSQALRVSGQMNQTPSEEIQNGANASTNDTAKFQFIQNNYSPKALSRVEIYRQTKNQFSAMERMVRA